MATKDMTNTTQQPQPEAPATPRYTTPTPVGGKSFMDHQSLAEGAQDFAGGLADTLGGTLSGVGNLMASPLSFKDGGYDTAALKNAGSGAVQAGTGLLNTVGGLGKALGGLALDPLRMFGMFGGEEGQPQTPVVPDPDPVDVAIKATFSDKPAEWISDEAWARGKEGNVKAGFKEVYDKAVPENWNNVVEKTKAAANKSQMSLVPGSEMDMIVKAMSRAPEKTEKGGGETHMFPGPGGIFPGVNWAAGRGATQEKKAPAAPVDTDISAEVESYKPGADKDTLALLNAKQEEVKAPETANDVYTAMAKVAEQMAGSSDPDMLAANDTKWLSTGFRPYPNSEGMIYKVLPSGEKFVLFDTKTGRKTIIDIKTNQEV